ncbi:MAG: bifunctional folylpolyglutamate synthase/dihydrofolate synthase [Candidatus Binatia bacterium]
MASYSETLDRIYNLRGGIIDLRLDRMERALALFGQPHEAFPSIHIAGTNGKGSTAAMLHRILSDGGYRTALYTSPHLVSFTERIRIDGEEIAAQDVVAIAGEIWRETAAADVALTFFEFITVMALVYFARRRVDIAVVEVGLGGRLDATNVVTPLVSVITTVAKDHEAYLGPDEFSIAREKGGIIKPGVPLACGKLSAEVADLLREIARQRQSPGYSLGREFSFSLKPDGLFDYRGIKQHFFNLELGLPGRHQRANAAVALAALELVRERFPVAEGTLREGLRQVRWPGRLEVMRERPTVILDGAHNPEGIKALVEELNDLRQGRKIKLLFATMADKEWGLMLRALARAVNEITFTRVNMERSADPEILAAKLSEPIAHRVIADSRHALRTLLDEADERDLIVVAGSLYLLGEVRPMLQQVAEKL